MKRRMNLGGVIGLVVLALLVSVRADDRFVDYDTGVNFSVFRTFTIVTGQTRSTAPEINNAITSKGIRDAIRQHLISRKLREVAQGADLTVTWSMGTEARRGSRPLTAGRPRRVPFTYTEGTLVIEVADAQSRLVWFGSYRDDEGNPAKLAEHLPRHAASLLMEYPPRK